MSKKIVTLIMAAAFTVGVAGVSLAAKQTCEVKSVDGKTVTMECPKADKLSAGDKVKVSPAKRAVEGC